MPAKNYPKLVEVVATDDYELVLSYSNNERRTYDFKNNLTHPFYKELNNLALFKKVNVTDGEIEWVSGQDFCPHTLYENSL